MKLILSTILGGLVIFIGGWILFGIIYMNLYGGPEMVLWKVALSCLAQALFMAIIYPYGYKGGSPAVEGLKFGLWIGFLMTVPRFFYEWAVPHGPAARVILIGALFGGILTLLAGLVIGLVYGKKSETVTTP